MLGFNGKSLSPPLMFSLDHARGPLSSPHLKYIPMLFERPIWGPHNTHQYCLKRGFGPAKIRRGVFGIRLWNAAGRIWAEGKNRCGPNPIWDPGHDLGGGRVPPDWDQASGLARLLLLRRMFPQFIRIIPGLRPSYLASSQDPMPSSVQPKPAALN